jgi:hypothetical protein
MSDIINQIDNTGTGESEQWITIKDASDLLGVSERHSWNIITARGFQTKKLLNQHRKKTYVLRLDIEQFHQAEQERQKLEALKGSPLSAISEKQVADSESAISESHRGNLKTLPAMLKDMQTREVKLQKDIVKWRVTALAVSMSGLVICCILWLSLNEMKNSFRIDQQVIRDSQKALSVMSERLFMISEREKSEVKNIDDREIYIKSLEDTIKKEQGK